MTGDTFREASIEGHAQWVDNIGDIIKHVCGNGLTEFAHHYIENSGRFSVAGGRYRFSVDWEIILNASLSVLYDISCKLRICSLLAPRHYIVRFF
jgi:hypothetical protein